MATSGPATAARPAGTETPADSGTWTESDRRYWPAVAVVVALGAALRLYRLDAPPLQCDESIYSTFSLNFHDPSGGGGGYNFDPTYHGPALYHIVKLFFLAFGDTDFVARLVSVVMGLVTFALVIGPVRRRLGGRGALFALALYALSPVMVTYERRILFDAFVVVLTLGAVLLLQKIRESTLGTWRWCAAWVGLVALLTIFLATKANAFFVIVMLLSFWMCDRLRGWGPRDWIARLPTQLPLMMFAAVTAAAVVTIRYPDDKARTASSEMLLALVGVMASALLWEWLRRPAPVTGSKKLPPATPASAPVRYDRIAVCTALSLIAGATVFAFLFGHGYLWLISLEPWCHPAETLRRYGPDVMQAMPRMLAYWGGQQKTPRLPGRHDFYLPLMIAYELPILLAFVAGVRRASQKRTPFTDLLLWWSFTSWTLYTMANEKVPWLLIHLIAPFALLGGWWLGQLRPRRGLAISLGLGAAYLLRNVSATNYERAVDNREPMFYAFTSESFKDTFFKAAEIGQTKTGDFWIYNAWPPSWYIRPSSFGAKLAPGSAYTYPEHDPPAGPLRFVVCMEPDWEKFRHEPRFAGWHQWTWDKKEAALRMDAGGENPQILNWPRLSWSSFQPDLFVKWFVFRTAEVPDFPPNPDHATFLTEWSDIRVVVATPP
jgi:uncharacterized protein (TIGR03663 family)